MANESGRLTADDRFEIQELFARYSWAFDTGDVPTFVSLFAPDAAFVLPNGTRFVGHEAIRGYFETRTQAPNFLGRQHNMTNLVIEGDTNRCTVRSYGFRGLKLATGETSFSWLGQYHDVLVKHEGQWRFAERAVGEWVAA
jgi:ketosteroid isomerase-like protein